MIRIAVVGASGRMGLCLIRAAVLAEKRLANPGPAQPRYEFYVTDVPLRFQTIGERFLGRTLNNVHMVKW